MRLLDDTTDPDTLPHRNLRWEMAWHWKRSFKVVCKDPRRAQDAVRADRYLLRQRLKARRWLREQREEAKENPVTNVIPFPQPNHKPSV